MVLLGMQCRLFSTRPLFFAATGLEAAFNQVVLTRDLATSKRVL